MDLKGERNENHSTKGDSKKKKQRRKTKGASRVQRKKLWQRVLRGNFPPTLAVWEEKSLYKGTKKKEKKRKQ